MKTIILAIAASSLLTLGVPAFAQNAGAPGATGAAGCGLSGSNTGTCQYNNWNDYNGAGPNGYYRTDPGYMTEGRAAAPDYEPTGPDSPVYVAPRGGDPDMAGPGYDRDAPNR